jgi:hypothetical protein
MTVTVTYTLQNTNSEYEVVGLGTPDPLTTLEGIYGNRDWSFDLVFSGSDDTTGDSISIISIVTTTPEYVLETNTTDTVTLYRNPASLVFPGEQYRFVNFNSQEEFTFTDLTSLPEGLSVIGWDTPAQEEITGSYTFTITYDIPAQFITNQTTIVTLSQDFIWDFAPGFAKLQQQVTNSEK